MNRLVLLFVVLSQQKLTAAPLGSRILSDALDMNLICEYRCTDNKDLALAPLKKVIFDPDQIDLSPGNGGMYSMLGVNLWMWGQEVCLKKAASECGGEEKTYYFVLKNMTSGNWSMREKPICAANKTLVGTTLSPYEPSLKVVRSFSFGRTSATDKSLAKGSSLNWHLHGHRLEAKEKCDTPIKANVCFGDCMAEDSNWKQTLSTLKPARMPDQGLVCADKMIQGWLDSSYETRSLTQLQLACEMYFYQSISLDSGGTKSSLTSCAAFRAASNCQEIATKFKLNRGMNLNNEQNPGPSKATTEHNEAPKCCAIPHKK